MTNKKSINDRFSEDQISDLSTYIVDMYGPDLSFDELNESIYLELENLPGIESVSIQNLKLLNKKIRKQYYDKTNGKK